MDEVLTVDGLRRMLTSLGARDDQMVVLEVDGRRVVVESITVEVWGTVVLHGGEKV